MYDVLWLMFSVLTKNATVENSGIFLKFESLTTKQFLVTPKSSKVFCILFFAEVRNIFVVMFLLAAELMCVDFHGQIVAR